MKELISDTTVFVIYSGEQTYQECLQALANQDCDFLIKKIENITPMDRAFQQMIDQCDTEFYVQVDADMILYPHSIRLMRKSFEAMSFISSFDQSAQPSSNIAMLFFPLMDAHLERQIIGVKIYRKSILENFPYESGYSCEVTQLDRMRAEGFHISYQDNILGRHGTEWTPLSVFERYKRLYFKSQKFSSSGHDYSWMNPYPRIFAENYRRHGKAIDLFAFAGAVAGMASGQQSENIERDASAPDVTGRMLTTLLLPHTEMAGRTARPVRASVNPHVMPVPARNAGRRGAANIVLVTDEFPGLGSYGGIGRAMHLLSQELSREGHNVTILFLTQDHVVDENPPREYRVRIEQVVVEVRPGTNRKAAVSWAAMTWLRKRNFDFIHFSDYNGIGYYSLKAKKQGLLFSDSDIIVQCHGPSKFLRPFQVNDEQDISYLSFIDVLEKRSVELADIVVSPTRFLIDWMAGEGYVLPHQTFILQNVPSLSSFENNDEIISTKPDEIIFFGKQIDLKGVELFCDAMDLLEFSGHERITFIGRSGIICSEDSYGYIIYRSRAWKARLSLFDKVNSDEFIIYASSRKCVVVIPSLIENAPYAVVECLHAGIPVVASDVGGVRELLHVEDADQVLFKPAAVDLAGKIKTILANGIAPARPRQTPTSIVDGWLALHQGIRQRTPSQLQAALNDSRVTVCITHKNRPALAREAVESCMRQSYSALCVIVVDDRSELENRRLLDEALSEFPRDFITIVDGDGGGLSAARNIGSAAANSEIIVFLDDDDYLLPNAIERMLRVMQTTGSDFVTCGYRRFRANEFDDVFADSERNDYLGLGQEITAGLINNVFGPAMCMTTKTALEILGGYSRKVSLYEDWDIYLRASHIGLRLEHIAEALFLYRDTAASMSKTGNHLTNHARILLSALENSASAEILSIFSSAILNITTKSERIRRWSAIDIREKSDLFHTLNRNIAATERQKIICDLLESFGRPETAFEYAHYSIEKGRLASQYPVAPGGGRRFAQVSVLENIDALHRQADMPYVEVPDQVRRLIQNIIGDLGASDPAMRLLAMKLARSAIAGGHHKEALGILLTVSSYQIDSASATGLALCFDRLGDVELAASYRDKADLLRSTVEEQVYLAKYDDVRKAIENGSFRTGLDHYLNYGRKEGRIWDYFGFWQDFQEDINAGNNIRDSSA